MYYCKFRTCIERNFEVLSKCQIYASKRTAFNDEYETTLLRDQLKDYLKSKPELEPLVKELQGRIDRRAYYCVSCSDNLLSFALNRKMWEEYAADSTGFCIVYNDKLLEGLVKDQSYNSYINIIYADVLADLPAIDIDSDRMLLNILESKTKKWEDESEVRLIFRTVGCVSINRDAFECIILGSKISDENKMRLCAIAKDLGVPCMQLLNRDSRLIC